MESLLSVLKNAAEEKKAYQPLILDLNGISPVTDFFLICSAQTSVQVRAISDNIIDRAMEAGFKSPQKEGYQDGRWVLLDFGGIVVHVLTQQEREFYSLENLWHDAKVIN